MTEYIEREKAIEEIQAWATNVAKIKNLNNDALCVLNLIQAADVAPVVRAHWTRVAYYRESTGEYDIDMLVCSNCQHEYSFDEETGVSAMEYNYCPNCGAKMCSVNISPSYYL